MAAAWMEARHAVRSSLGATPFLENIAIFRLRLEYARSLLTSGSMTWSMEAAADSGGAGVILDTIILTRKMIAMKSVSAPEALQCVSCHQLLVHAKETTQNGFTIAQLKSAGRFKMFY